MEAREEEAFIPCRAVGLEMGNKWLVWQTGLYNTVCKCGFFSRSPEKNL